MVKVRAHVFVSGIVQGVFFRQKTKQQAERLGVMGWIRNLPDGRVEAILEGEEDAVRALADFAVKGPGSAVVRESTMNWEEFTGEFEGFEITY